MLRKVILPVIFAVLSYGFWISPNLKEICAGVSIFLFSMLFLEEGFKAFTGGLLERLLKTTTDRQWKALLFGFVAATLMQCSSLVSVITISFLSAGLIWLSAGLGIIFGANIGTTTGAWLIAGFGLKVDIAAYAMPMLVFGIILVFQSAKSLKGCGYILAGLGFLFLGIHYMKEGFDSFKETIDLAAYATPGFAGLLLFTLIGTVATILMQSSHASLVLIITALAAGQVTYENALGLAIGANIGTTITAVIASFKANYQGKRLAAAHFLFKLVTACIAVPLIGVFVWSVDAIAAGLGIAETDYALKLAVFHSLFNVVGVVLMMPLIPQIEIVLRRLIPKPREETAEPRYITTAVFDFPETLLGAVRQETQHLYENAVEVMTRGLDIDPAFIRSPEASRSPPPVPATKIEYDVEKGYLTTVKSLFAVILDFISRAHTALPARFGSHLYALRDACQGIALAVKTIESLRENTLTYIRSDNTNIKEPYTFIRAQIAELMGDIHRLGQLPEDERDVLELDRFKFAIDEEYLTTKNSVEELILGGRITALMASSLVNDLEFARTIIWRLVDVGKALHGAHGDVEKEIEDALALDEQDVTHEIGHATDKGRE